MNRIKHKSLNRTMLAGATLLVVASACSSGDQDPSATFDGASCSFDGTTSVRAGGFEMPFNNQSGEFAALAFLELPEDEATRTEELALVGSDGPIPAEPDPNGAQLAGFIMAEPGEEVTQEASLPEGTYVVDCTTFEGDRPSHAWRAAVLEVEG